jgi:hypothetical protein
MCYLRAILCCRRTVAQKSLDALNSWFSENRWSCDLGIVVTSAGNLSDLSRVS